MGKLKMGVLKFIILLSFLVMMCDSKKPNILIFMADDLGYGDIGVFGNTTIRTPHIDGIAKEGMKFTQFLTTSPLCTPSRAAFLTGRYPSRLGLTANHRFRVIPFIASSASLPPNETTFAEVAKKNGYRTAFIGKWHVGTHCTEFGDFCAHPIKRGFDYFYGCLLTLLKDFGDTGEAIIASYNRNYYRTTTLTALASLLVPAILWCLGIAGRKLLFLLLFLIFLGFILTYNFPYTGIKFMNSVLHRNLEVVEMPIRFENLTQRLVWESVEFLENQSKENDAPFLLYVSWLQVHTVLYNSVPGFRGRSAHGEYGDNVEEMDWSVGQVLNALDRLGLAKDTLVLFTSDNGGHIEETNRLGHRTGGYNGPWRGGKAHGGFDGGYRVPTVIRWPGVVAPGSSSDEPASFLDVFPTLVNIMGQSSSPKVHLDGANLLPLLRGTKQPLPFGERFLFHYCAKNIFAIRWRRSDGVWKLRLASPDWLPGSEQCDYVCACFESIGAVFHSEPRLHKLDEDPQERHPLDTRIAAYREIKEKMIDAMKDHLKSIGDVPPQFTMRKTLYMPWLQPCCNFPFCNCKDTKWSHQ